MTINRNMENVEIFNDTKKLIATNEKLKMALGKGAYPIHLIYNRTIKLRQTRQKNCLV